jgi:hypothetical protein
MGLTTDQRAAWETMRVHEAAPTGDQTPEQARSLAVASFKHWCVFDGLGTPSDQAIEAEFSRQLDTNPAPNRPQTDL